MSVFEEIGPRATFMLGMFCGELVSAAVFLIVWVLR